MECNHTKTEPNHRNPCSLVTGKTKCSWHFIVQSHCPLSCYLQTCANDNLEKNRTKGETGKTLYMEKIVLRLLLLSKEDCLTLYPLKRTCTRPSTVVRLRILKVLEPPWSMTYSWMLKVSDLRAVSNSWTNPFNDQIKVAGHSFGDGQG